MKASTFVKTMKPGLSLSRAKSEINEVNAALREANCNTVNRVAMFLAQTGQESMSLRYTEEIASGAAYEWRSDLGNTQQGDGRRFKGRSYIQVTGRHNYTNLSHWAYSQGLVPSKNFFVNSPAKLASKKYRWLGPVWYWRTQRPMNKHADNGSIRAGTIAVNGGTHGLAERTRRWKQCRRLGKVILPAEGKGSTASKPVTKTGTFTTKGTRIDMAQVKSGGKQKFRSLTSTDGGYPGCACGCLAHVIVLTEALLQERGELKPGQKLGFWQGGWSSGVAASAGTHGGGGVIDVRVTGYTSKGVTQVVKAFRQAGAPATWERKMGAKYGNMKTHHIHGVVAGCSHVSSGAKSQLTAVKNGRNGLANNGADYGPKVKYVTWKTAWSKLTKTTTASGAKEKVEDIDMLKQLKTLHRSKNQTVPSNGKWQTLALTNKGGLSWALSGGPKQIYTRVAFSGISADDDLFVRVARYDKAKKKGKKNSGWTNYLAVGLPGGNDTTYRDFWWQYRVPTPKKGFQRRLRLRAMTRSGHPVKVHSIKMYRWRT